MTAPVDARRSKRLIFSGSGPDLGAGDGLARRSRRRLAGLLTPGGSWWRRVAPGDLSAAAAPKRCVIVAAFVRGGEVWLRAAAYLDRFISLRRGRKPGENSGRFAEEPSLPQTSEAIGSGARVLLER
jgi:hypothetical protein